MREIELHGGPAHGKRISVDLGVSRIVVPALSKAPFDFETIQLVAMPFSGRLVPAPLLMVRCVYAESDGGFFQYQGELV